MTTKEAVEKVLARRRKPMPVSEIIEKALPLATGLRGVTPKQTLYSVIYGETKKPNGLVVQTGKGEFRLNPKRARSNGKGRA